MAKPLRDGFGIVTLAVTDAPNGAEPHGARPRRRPGPGGPARRGRPERPYLARMPPHPADVRDFERDGFLVVPDALPPAEVRRLRALTRPGSPHRACRARRLRPSARVHRPRAGVRRPRRPSARARPGVRDVGLERAHVPLPSRRAPTHSPKRPPRWRWHQDGGRQNLEIESDPRPRLSVKVAWFLSDVSTTRARQPPGDPRQPSAEPSRAPGPSGRGLSPTRRCHRGARRPRHRGDLRPAPVACARREPVAKDAPRTLSRLHVPLGEGARRVSPFVRVVRGALARSAPVARSRRDTRGALAPHRRRRAPAGMDEGARVRAESLR